MGGCIQVSYTHGTWYGEKVAEQSQRESREAPDACWVSKFADHLIYIYDIQTH